MRVRLNKELDLTTTTFIKGISLYIVNMKDLQSYLSFDDV